MKSEMGFEVEFSAQIEGSVPESGFKDISIQQSDETRPDSNGLDHCYVPRVRQSEANGFAVYARNKRLKNGGGKSQDRIGYFDKLQGLYGNSYRDVESVSSNGGVVGLGGDLVNAGGVDGCLGTSGFKEGDDESEMLEIEVKEEPMAVVAGSDLPRRFTRSALKLNADSSETESESLGELQDAVVLDSERLENGNLSGLGTSARKMEMKMSKKIAIKGRPTTVRELFETGLLEGYPVFYNGGKRGFPLRGTIKDAGILCSCSLCRGARVVPPCQFEIHACKSYRRASQYICLENGKSLLDVVKECRKSSLKTLEDTIQNFIGPMPVKESVTCRNCAGLFLATSAGKMDQLCDSCTIILNSEADTECVKSRPLEPLLGLTSPESGEVHTAPRKKGRRGKKKRKHSELTSNVKSPRRSSVCLSSRNASHWKIKKLSQSASALNSPGSASVRYLEPTADLNSNSSTSLHCSLKNKTPRKMLKLVLSDSISHSNSLKSTSTSVSAQSKASWKITKKDQRMHKLVFEDGGLPDGTEVAYYSHGKKLRDGYKMGSGIVCHCCDILVSPSQFEAHAGWASRRKPYMYIYTSNGVSLHEFAISLLKGRKYSAKDNDDLCIICADGGKLVLCDGCPRAFHKECASLPSIPRGKWYCTYCQNMFLRERFVEHNANAVAAGRVSGIDPIEQITNRCIRIVKNPEEAEVIACVICRGYDFSKSGFGPRTVILCDQCEKEYHVGCLKKCKMADLKELPKGKWFCSADCKRIYSALQDLLNAGEEKLPDPSLDVIKKKHEGNCLDVGDDFDVRWRLLNGKIASRETRVLLSQAVAIFHDCFDPIVDSETGRDFIPSMVYGRNIRGQDFGGMYCAILMVNSTVVSAGILRIFGQEIAELPLVATRIGNQGKGYFQTLFSCIENLLSFLKVRSFVLPAADEAKSIWTEKFGFNNIPQEQLLNYRKICWQMISFKGTSMLGKTVQKCLSINQDEADSEIPLQ
ncbi:Acyl-CoA N-acyltransferase with RING/FYVE/PHD-type zinc finger domain [Abeliophyllum distichum]|uniref:Acyl-CoA N-acyltransferase with RING/FYVE/PHD-type zinc finger domain n=1 Tax=Abeliophyllum distichum TaxID=126358 RepID=A0ABD1R145_9LAMI